MMNRDLFGGFGSVNRQACVVAAIVLGGFLVATSVVRAESPPRRNFTLGDGATALKLSEKLEVSASNLAPELDATSGQLNGLAASGGVLIRVRPEGSEMWILVHCEKASYDIAEDVILLSGWPAVKRGVQVLRATSGETSVRVARKSGKWEIKGPHRIEISLK